MTPPLPEFPPKPLCPLCALPLGDFELNLAQSWHSECNKCHYCGGTHLQHDRVQHCLDKQIPISHITCHDALLASEIKNKILPLTREHVRLLNDQILTIRSQQPADGDVELLFATLKDLQECAANVSFVLTLTKDKIRIDESQQYSEKIKTERKAQADVAAVDEEKKQRLAAERADPALRERRKAIEGLMKAFGVTIEAATAMIDAQSKRTQ